MPDAARAGGQRPGGDRRSGTSSGQRSRTPSAPRSTQRPSERRRTSDAARLAAYTVLRAVDRDGAYANLELPRQLRAQRVRGRDAAFATELTYGALRMHGLYDPVIAVAASRDLGRIDAGVRDVLRLGVHQLLGMRVPPHAAVSETVALARQVTGAGAAGLVNAVLRRVGERSREDWVAEVTRGLTDPLARLAVEHSHPQWVVRAFRVALHGSAASTVSAAWASSASSASSAAETVDADLVALLEADNARARVSLVARPGLCEVAELVSAGAVASSLSPVGATLPAGDPGGIPAVREGRAGVQDEGSQLLTLALAAAPLVDGPDANWLDLCAGPGGKAALLAALARERGAALVANEVSPHRAELVRHTVAAAQEAGARVEVRVGDGRSVGAEEPATYDRVLVDAPCTGLGALRRRPEARWRRQPQDVAHLALLQRQLLESALDATRPGGLVGYATCSPHLVETRFVVEDVLKRRNATALDARPLLVDASGMALGRLGAGPSVQLWPHVHGTDAMFFALLRKDDRPPGGCGVEKHPEP